MLLLFNKVVKNDTSSSVAGRFRASIYASLTITRFSTLNIRSYEPIAHSNLCWYTYDKVSLSESSLISLFSKRILKCPISSSMAGRFRNSMYKLLTVFSCLLYIPIFRLQYLKDLNQTHTHYQQLCYN